LWRLGSVEGCAQVRILEIFPRDESKRSVPGSLVIKVVNSVFHLEEVGTHIFLRLVDFVFVEKLLDMFRVIHSAVLV